MNTLFQRTLVPTAMVLLPILMGACSGDPTTSYCQAVCDLAVSCAETEREVDAQATMDACLSETKAIDETCADAEEGNLNPATLKLLEPCVNALQEATTNGECDPFTGSIDAIKTGITPPVCAGQGLDAQAVYDAARNATNETGSALCTRFTESICEQLDTCIVSEYYPGGEVPQDVTDLTGTPKERCISSLEAVTSGCIDSDLYSAEDSLDDLNTARQGARECLAGFEAASCDELLAGELPEFCAVAFTSTDSLISFGTSLVEVAVEFQDLAQ